MPVCESGTASPSKLEEIIIELMLFTMPRFSILKTRTRSSVRNLGVEKVSIAKVEQDSSVVDVFQYPEDSLPSRDIKPVNIVNEFSENSKLTHKIEETDIVTYFTNLKKLANLFYQANNAKKSTIKSKRTEISSWCCYSERFEDKVMELRSDKKLTDQTTYNEMKPFLTEDAPAEERTDEVVCAEEEYLTSLGVLDEDVDIKIFWGGGKSDGAIQFRLRL
ncbi:11035_t:CDS:2 [Rhizophagus irregularis]|nr:11035_t:CDS:2 [Rhizophagus irregularis]